MHKIFGESPVFNVHNYPPDPHDPGWLGVVITLGVGVVCLTLAVWMGWV